MDLHKDRYSITDLKQLMARLRDKENGCPWDIEQDFNSIKPHTIEEAYEVADAIERGNMPDLKDELGDLLFQVLFHAQMADEQSLFNFDDVVDHVMKKMVFRHPHVFGDDVAQNADDVKDRVWEDQKAKERSSRAQDSENEHYLDSVTRALPSLSLANKIQSRVRKVGFKYADIGDVFDKLDEETKELKDAIASGDRMHIQEEYGDVLIIAALLGKHLDMDAEQSLRMGCFKFMQRFNAMEDYLKHQSRSLEDADIADMMAAWDVVKRNNNQKP